ncbi:uncharacterized protein G2W53_044098 [Senna tora]|uniref:Uncharacterized protein n=1 Tax=Senna tora TaxID=362788 RepID=A0A834SJX3_9FABA|nr:uncharacterized protein G2W53_044098 [Senna tora]
MACETDKLRLGIEVKNEVAIVKDYPYHTSNPTKFK